MASGRGGNALPNIDEMDLNQIKKAIASSKGQVTRIARELTKQADTIKPENVKSSTLATNLLEKMRKLEEHIEIVSSGYHEWLYREPTKKDELDKKLNDFYKDLDVHYEKIYPFMTMLPSPTAAAIPRPKLEGKSEKSDQPPKPNLSLKPETLQQDHTPIELKHWIKKFLAFYRTSQLEKLTVTDQRAYLNSCLDATVSQVLEARAPEALEIYNDDLTAETCLSKLQDMWLDRYPLFQRRHAFFTATYHNKNVKEIPSFLAKVEELATVAEIDEMSESNIIAYRALSAITDKELRKACWKEDNLTMERFRVLALERVREQENLSALQTDVRAQLAVSDEILAAMQRTLDQVVCWDCKQKGHYATDCPKRKKKGVYELPAEDEDDDDDDDDEAADANAVKRQGKKSPPKKNNKKKGGKVRSAEADGAEDDEQESSDEAKTNSVTVTERVLGTFGME